MRPPAGLLHVLDERTRWRTHSPKPGEEPTPQAAPATFPRPGGPHDRPSREHVRPWSRLLTVAGASPMLLGTTERFPRRLIAERRVSGSSGSADTSVSPNPHSASSSRPGKSSRRRSPERKGRVEPEWPGRDGISADVRRRAVRPISRRAIRGPDGGLRPCSHGDVRGREGRGRDPLARAQGGRDQARRLGSSPSTRAGCRSGDYAQTSGCNDRVLKPRTEPSCTAGPPASNHLLAGLPAASDLRDIRRGCRYPPLAQGAPRLPALATGSRPFGPVTVAKAYRLLHADPRDRGGPIGSSAATRAASKGAGQEESPERAVDSAACRARRIARPRCPPRYRALALLATFASLRCGELAGLRRRGQVDLDGMRGPHRRRRRPRPDRRQTCSPTTPKSRAGRRTG